MSITIQAIGLATPSISISQEYSVQLANRLSQSETNDSLRKKIAAKTGITSRHSVLVTHDENGNKAVDLFQPSRTDDDLGPSTSDRMKAYETHAETLASAAVTQCINLGNASPSEIGHLVSCSCTGFSSPGVDLTLIERFGLSHDISRTHVGFMGCHGLLNALQVSRAIGNLENKTILCVAVELCSLHYQYSETTDQMIANSLFSDGAAALLLKASSSPAPHTWELVAQRSHIIPDTRNEITWKIRDHGFVMHLSREVPTQIKLNLKQFVTRTLEACNCRLAEVNGWAIHPGGPRILDAAAESLNLTDRDLASSREILKRHGNMSSPTIAFILERVFSQVEKGIVVAIAFGPGMTCEIAIFRRSQ